MSENQEYNLDKILTSSGRIRIISLLSRVEELHLTEIARRTDQSYTSTERHLTDLAKASVVEERDYGRIRIFQLKLDNPKVKMLKDLVLAWNHELDPKTLI